MSSRYSRIRRIALVAITVCALGGLTATATHADELSPSLAGTWKRVRPADGEVTSPSHEYGEGPEATTAPPSRYYVIEQSEDGSITGYIVQESLDTFRTYEIRLEWVAEDRLEGTATWEDTYEDGGVTYTFQAETRWELSFDGEKIRGRVEYVDWDLPAESDDTGGVELGRGWIEYEFHKLPRYD